MSIIARCRCLTSFRYWKQKKKKKNIGKKELRTAPGETSCCEREKCGRTNKRNNEVISKKEKKKIGKNGFMDVKRKE